MPSFLICLAFLFLAFSNGHTAERLDFDNGSSKQNNLHPLNISLRDFTNLPQTEFTKLSPRSIASNKSSPRGNYSDGHSPRDFSSSTSTTSTTSTTSATHTLVGTATSDSEEVHFGGFNSPALNKSSSKRRISLGDITDTDEYTSQPIQKSYGEFHEIDRDFFASSAQGIPIELLRATRMATALAIGILVSMPITGMVMILVGDWVGAIKDTNAASFLVTYVAFTSTLLFANICDNGFKSAAEFMQPSCVKCFSKDEEAIEAALSGKFSMTRAKKSWEHPTTLGLLSLSAAAYAFPSLWQVLWSAEEKFPTLSYFTLPPFYLLTAYMFYNVAKRNLTPIPSSEDAENKKEILKESVRQFKRKAGEDEGFRQRVYQLLKVKDQRRSIETLQQPNYAEKSPLVTNIPVSGIDALSNDDYTIFYFSLLFLVHQDADYYNSAGKRRQITQLYIEAIKNPSFAHRKQQIESIVDHFLGIGWLTMTSLLHGTFQSPLIKLGTKPQDAYWISLTAAALQSASFIRATHHIYHSYDRNIARLLMTENVASILSLPQRIIEKCQISCRKDGYLGAAGSGIGGGVRWLGGNIPSASNLASGVLLSLAELKRGLQTYTTYSYLEQVIGAGVPFVLGTFFFRSVFEDNTRNIYRRIVTSLPAYCFNMFDCCRAAHEEETLAMYADDAIDLIEELNENTQDMLFNQILQQQ